eukprot:scaffold10856_cov63-Phaeocystis_antarctica.AAC.3
MIGSDFVASRSPPIPRNGTSQGGKRTNHSRKLPTTPRPPARPLQGAATVRSIFRALVPLNDPILDFPPARSSAARSSAVGHISWQPNQFDRKRFL